MRFVQDIAGSGGIVISRSVATDKFPGRDLARMLTLIELHPKSFYPTFGVQFKFRP